MPEMRTTLGRVLVNKAVPESMRDGSRVFNKKTAKEFFAQLAKEHPETYVDVLDKLNTVSREAATGYGRDASISLDDLQIPPRAREYRKQLRARLHALSQRDDLDTEAKNAAIVNAMRKAMPIARKNLMDEVISRKGAFAQQVSQGLRGNPVQLSQILFGDMLLADHKGRPVPVAGTHGYGEGVTPQEYWAGSYASRAGYASVQFATAKTGFLGKQLAMMAEKLRVVSEDCGAEKYGIPADGEDPEIIGAVLARDVNGIKAGTVIEKKHLRKMAGKKPLIRSVITCHEKEGICQKCSGIRERGEFPHIGDYVGLTAARVVSEPATQQLALAAKHVGGVVGVNDDDASGFDEINQFVQIPQNFRGKSILAPEDGTVRQIVKAPQGGHYIHVNTQQLYVPPGREVEVQAGQKVEAGEMLTDGTPNPGEIAQLKGLGDGRLYFTNKFYEILKKNGIPSHRRNVDALARSYFDKVRITNINGVQGRPFNAVVSYNEMQKDYQPRQGAKRLRPSRLVGKYLEEPVLHYSIGTRITPKTAKFLQDEGINEVLAHDENPGFEPEVIRIMALPGADQDWKVNLAGFGIKKSFLERARTGSTSRADTTSYVPRVMDPTRL
jgi:DNA-directed RNA polymerase subunit beta'